MKKMTKTMLTLLFVAIFSIGLAAPVAAVSESILIYGEQLSESQRQDVREALGLGENEAVEEHDVTGQDYANYINGNPNANMYSSALIKLENNGEGLVVNILTPENITKVTSEMYENALLTAGAENVTVDVVSPIAVTGHSALTGIYKAYDVEGVELDKERMELANDELVVATDLAEREGVSEENVSQLLTEIKQMIAEQNPVTREEVEQIVSEQLNKLEINLSEQDRQMLIDLFDRMRELDIDFSGVRDQLKNIADSVTQKAEELGLDQGFWEKVANFFADLFEGIGNLFRGLFN
ncbi:DUF1002 domain-containing protein [Oceanobacillus luteolus]|uniref:DUF1002 domain-containing protein n=1 Tax=Oceanobacillus luteolus TaxID=1274358 RepID=A0ABW4HML1_9BACI|nr:DUF1002 domain-containing protein [Oceanobacillus luteolus]MCM3740711.1 DUF1002 domain-containing protein [Oceanobacillus luteolus]